MRRLLILDSLNILRRVYEANPAPDSAAKAKASIRNALSTVRRAVRESDATHILNAHDIGGPTRRHRLFLDYKAHRRPAPEHYQASLPEWISALDQLGIPTISIPGEEADDIMASAVREFLLSGGDQCVLCTTDKDCLQLLEPGRVIIRDLFNGVWRNPKWLQEKWGIEPKQVPDFLALVGDITDGIPGAVGIAEKGASQLLQEHQTLEGVYANLDKIKPAMRTKLENSRESVALSRQLTELSRELSVGGWRLIEGGPLKPAPEQSQMELMPG